MDYEEMERFHQHSDDFIKTLGFEPSGLQMKWRDNPPPYPADPPPYPKDNSTSSPEASAEWEEYWKHPAHEAQRKWWTECNYAVIDALVHNGIPAWSGDAVSCVAQIIGAVAKRERDKSAVP